MAEPGVTFVATSSMVHDAMHPVHAEVNTWLAAHVQAVSNILDTGLVRQAHQAEELGVGLLERDPTTARIPVSGCAADDRRLQRHREAFQHTGQPVLTKPFALADPLDRVRRTWACLSRRWLLPVYRHCACAAYWVLLSAAGKSSLTNEPF